MSKRFVMGGDTHIIDTKTNEEYYAPCETELLDLLNELSDENKTLKKENDDLRTTITKQVEAITEMKDLLYMFADLRIFDYSSEIEEDMQELKKAYDGNLEDLLKYFKD